MTYYIIGQKSPEGALHESEITHYLVAMTLEDAKANKGHFVKKEDLMKLVKEDDEILAYDHRNGHSWKLEIANK